MTVLGSFRVKDFERICGKTRNESSDENWERKSFQDSQKKKALFKLLRLPENFQSLESFHRKRVWKYFDLCQISVML